jgi:hypothetical protein
MVAVLDNTTTPRVIERTTIERTEDGSAGWAVAIIILLAVVAVGGYLFLRYRAPAAAPASNGGANINVTLPDTSGGSNASGDGTGMPAQAQ